MVLIRNIFSSTDRGSQGSGWAELWDNDESDLWDRGQPSVALIDWIESRPDSLPKPAHGRRLRALVPVRLIIQPRLALSSAHDPSTCFG